MHERPGFDGCLLVSFVRQEIGDVRQIGGEIVERWEGNVGWDGFPSSWSGSVVDFDKLGMNESRFGQESFSQQDR